MFNHPLRLTSLVATFGIAACLPLHALAGTAQVRSADGNTVTFEYSNPSNLRITTADTPAYIVANDAGFYSVTTEGGKPMVIDLAQAMTMFGDQLRNAAPAPAAGKVLKFERTGETREYAGITGHIYRLRFVDHEGVEREADIALSKDPRAVEYRDAMYGFVRRMSEVLDTGASAGDLQAELEKENWGVLAYGEDMVVTALSSDEIPASRFTLPAAPTDLSALGGMAGFLGGGGGAGAKTGGQSSGGIFSGVMDAIGNQGQRQTDRAGDATEDEVNKQTDEAVDNVMDKAFGKIFGN